MKKCFDLDPKNYIHPTDLTQMTSYLGLSELFDEYFDIATELDMDITVGLTFKVLEKFGREGNLEAYEKIVEDANKIVHDTWFHILIAEYYRIIDNYELSLSHIDMIKDEDHKMMTQYLSKDYLRAIIYKKMNQEDQSKSFFEEALADIEKQLNNVGDDPRFLASKGKILAYLGENEKAIKYGKMATDIISVENDKFQGVDYNYDLAKIFSICGEFENSIKENIELTNFKLVDQIKGFNYSQGKNKIINIYANF